MNNCRLCLTDFQSLEDFNIQNMQDKLKIVFSFEVTSSPNLPEGICSECVKIVSKFYDYSCLVHQNQLQLYSQTGDNSTETESSTNRVLQSEQCQLETDQEIQQTESETMDDNESFLVEEDGEWIHDDEIKIEEYEPDFEDSEDTSDEKTCHQTWKFVNNIIFHNLDMSCDVCQKDQYTFQNLEAHLKNDHARHCYIACCGQKLVSEQIISNHYESHRPVVKSKKAASTDYDNTNLNVFASVLKDFKQNLEGYEPLPNMELALQDHKQEMKKLYDVVDHLVQLHFPLDCELCDKKFKRLCNRRKHFKKCHPHVKYFVSCCGARFRQRTHSMRHLNHHWRRVIHGAPHPVNQKQSDRPTHSERICTIMEMFREELVQGGFTLSPSLGKKKLSPNQIKDVVKMQDFLIAKKLTLNCGVCDATLSSYTDRRDHFRVNHPKLRFYVECCGSKLYKRINIMVHILRHKKGLPTDRPMRRVPGISDEKMLQDDATIEAYYKMDCKLCDFKATSYLGLRSHFQKHHREEGFFITCCNTRFTQKPAILDHIAIHKNPNPFKCEHCGDTFSKNDDLKSHIINKHADVSFKCDICDESYSTKRNLMDHKYRHKLTKCTICAVELARSAVQRHMKSHEKKEELVCPDCPKVFHYKDKLYVHRRNVHLKKRKKQVPQSQTASGFACPICLKILGSKRGLKNHQRILHDGKKE